MSEERDPTGDEAGATHPQIDWGNSGYDTAGAALRALEPGEQREVADAASSDSVVAAELAEMERIAAELARLVPSATISRGRSAGIRSRLVSRAAGAKDGRPQGRPTPAQVPVATHAQREADASVQARHASTMASLQSRRERAHASESASRRPRTLPVGTLLAAAALLVVAALGGTYFLRNARTPDQSTVASRSDTLTRQIDSMRAELMSRDSTIAALTGPSTKVMDLVSFSSAAPRARVFWNQRTDKWMMFASRLPAPPAGRTYELWMIANGHATPIPGGTFKPDASGNAVMVTTAALEAGSLRSLAVTDEPEGGSDVPTGERLIAGAGK